MWRPVTALDFLAANPRVSIIELAKRLNRGASAIGLIMATYEEAAAKGIVRNIAKDLLIRQIYAAFPHGWPGLSLTGPLVEIGSWSYEVARYVRDSNIGASASAIIRDLTIDHQPARFWTPEPKNDPVIDALFDRYWPFETNDG